MTTQQQMKAIQRWLVFRRSETDKVRAMIPNVAPSLPLPRTLAVIEALMAAYTDDLSLATEGSFLYKITAGKINLIARELGVDNDAT